MRLLILVLLNILAIGVFAQTPSMDKKVSPRLKIVMNQHKLPDKDSVNLLLSVSHSDVFEKKFSNRIEIISAYKTSGSYLVTVAVKDLETLLASAEVLFADIQRIPIEELTTGAFDITVNQINLAHHNNPQHNGADVLISIKEQKLDTTDIDFKGRYKDTKLAASITSDHASIMATMTAGGGNTSPYAKGAAWGANLTSSDFSSLLPDPDSVYQRYKVSVQNHSYGTGIENYYGADAAAYDMTVQKNPWLVHVFSAGNSGTATPTAGNYSGISGYANLTGSFKHSKNTISVGAIDSFLNIVSFSSRGPAYDGRVKPELVAFGFDGSSGSAALVSGSVALLQDAYKSMHQDSMPTAALIKAVLINTADDVGAPNIDFASGYGSMNADAAMRTILNSQFYQDSVSSGEEKQFMLQVPANSSKVKLTLVWTDTTATANATKALVNDLDAELKLIATGETWLPWVLNSAPHIDSLVSAPIRKRDTLNNVEQISLENPAAGDYLIVIKGREVTSKQHYAVAYSVEEANQFQWTYPLSSNPILNDKATVLRWETNLPGNGVIEYSINGSGWIHAGDADLSQNYSRWIPPVGEGEIVFRMTSGSNSILSDTIVLSSPINLKVGFNCPDSFLLYWNLAGLNGYQLYKLGEKYMEPFALSSDTIEILQKSTNASFHYAVAPIQNAQKGFRSYTINYTTQAVECYLRSFLAELQNNMGVLRLSLGSIYNIAAIHFQKLTPDGYNTLSTIIPGSTLLNYTDSFLTQGINSYRVVIQLSNGQELTSSTEHIYYLPADPVIVFPNPARQHEPIRIATSEIFVYSVFVYDASGKLVYSQALDNTVQEIQPFRLSKGLYFVRMLSEEGRSFTRKLVVQ